MIHKDVCEVICFRKIEGFEGSGQTSDARTAGTGIYRMDCSGVADKHLTLKQLAEQTGLSRSAPGRYESDEYKDISPFAIAALADFYGVSADYLMGLTETKNHPDKALHELHLSDDMIDVLKSGKLNNRLLCEMVTHENFRRFLVDAEIYTDRIADMRINDMNVMLDMARLQAGQSAQKSRSAAHTWKRQAETIRYVLHK